MTEERYAEIFNETLTTMDKLGLKNIGEVIAHSKEIYAKDPSDTHTSVLLKDTKMSEEQNIMQACEHADNVLEYLVKHGLVGEEMLFHGKDVDSDDKLDPSGFTQEGRDLFEFIYNIVRTTWEESQ
tara:strand:- start:601 stop:978 length:378 start_codon:yes stop_codon:yes gene_type:complete